MSPLVYLSLSLQLALSPMILPGRRSFLSSRTSIASSSPSNAGTSTGNGMLSESAKSVRISSIFPAVPTLLSPRGAAWCRGATVSPSRQPSTPPTLWQTSLLSFGVLMRPLFFLLVSFRRFGLEAPLEAPLVLMLSASECELADSDGPVSGVCAYVFFGVRLGHFKLLFTFL